MLNQAWTRLTKQLETSDGFVRVFLRQRQADLRQVVALFL